jgi:BolA protein
VSSETVELLRQRLAVLQSASITIEDESHRHAGHAGARDGGHYKLDHRRRRLCRPEYGQAPSAVYDAAGDLMRGRIHALSIRAFSPDEV